MKEISLGIHFNLTTFIYLQKDIAVQKNTRKLTLWSCLLIK